MSSNEAADAAAKNVRAVRVSNVSTMVPEATVRSLFAIFGEISKLLRIEGGSEEDETHNAFFIEYTVPDAAAKALRADGIDLLPSEPVSVASFTSPLPGRGKINRRGADITVDHTRRHQDTLRRTVYLNNLYRNVTLSDLKTYFSICGTVRGLKFDEKAGTRDTQARSAFIEFWTPESRDNCLKLSGNWLGDRPFAVQGAQSIVTDGAEGYNRPLTHEEAREEFEAPRKAAQDQAIKATEGIFERLARAKRARTE